MGRKLLILGIDGATWDVIHPLLARGELPRLAALVAEGACGPLRSTLPPQSAPAWVSLVTGQNPGRHGIFDFWARDLRQYDDPAARLNQSTAFAGQTIWDYAGAAGLRVGVVSAPVTYPAWPVNGFLISGTLLAPGMDQRAAYPPELAERYGLELNFPEAYRYGASREEVMREGPAMMLRRKEAVLELLAQSPCDLLMVVMGETDKAQHDFWRYLEPDCPAEEKARYGEVIAAHYRLADQALGEILDAFGPDPLVAVVSDHGAGPYPRRAFRTNAWLRQQGLLATRGAHGPLRTGLHHLLRQAKHTLPGRLQAALRQSGGGLLQELRGRYTGLHEIKWPLTRAYRAPMQPPVEGIVINLQGRQPEGTVPPDAYEETVEEIAARLRAFADPQTGQPVVEQVYRRDQVYQGPYVEAYAPDLVAVMAEGYKGEWGNDPPIVTPVPPAERLQYRGAHAMDGILVLSGPGLCRGKHVEGATLVDIAPTLLHALELPVPTRMDGRVLLDVFEPERARPVRYTEVPVPPLPVDAALSAADEREIVERLRGLGYVE